MNTIFSILWCPQHQPTKRQLEELPKHKINLLSEIDSELFKSLSSLEADSDLDQLTDKLIKIISVNTHVVLPIGSPAFMFLLSTKLSRINFHYKTILFAHSKRVSEETISPEGEIIKNSKFIHEKFIVFNL